MKKLILLFPLLLSGCFLFPVDWEKIEEKTNGDQVQVETLNTEIVARAKVQAVKIPSEDRQTLLKMYSGMIAFIESGVPETTIIAVKHLQAVKKIYGWTENKYSDWNDLHESVLSDPKYTNKVDYQTPQKIGDVKDNLVNILSSLREGLK